MAHHNRLSVRYLGKCVVTLIALIVQSALFGEIALAQGAAQAFAAFGKGGVQGINATIWTAQQGNFNNNWVASPVGVCTTTPPCTGFFIETGYFKGHGMPGAQDNVLQQYAAWKAPDGEIDNLFGLGNLADNTWYAFTVVTKPAKSRWDLKRDGVIIYKVPYGWLNFSVGRMVACGGEAWNNGTDMAVECSNMHYRYDGAWNSFNYTHTQISGDYCVFKPYDFGAVGWGPC